MIITTACYVLKFYMRIKHFNKPRPTHIWTILTSLGLYSRAVCACQTTHLAEQS